MFIGPFVGEGRHGSGVPPVAQPPPQPSNLDYLSAEGTTGRWEGPSVLRAPDAGVGV